MTDSAQSEQCCPPFNPEPWDTMKMTWTQKRFLKDRYWSFMHIPLNIGKVIRRNITKAIKAEALPENVMLLSGCDTFWGGNIYIELKGDVPGAKTENISGTFLTKVFEGPFRDMGKWVKEMQAHVESQGYDPKRMFYYYTTCPKCAEKYGKNYVVILAEI